MSNGDDSSDDRGLAPVPPGMKRYTVRNKTGDAVTVIGKIGADAERIKQKAAEEFARRASTPAAVDVPGALVHGIARGIAGELAPLGQAAQVEMGQVGPGFAPVPSAAETTKILEQQLPGFVPHHEARTMPGHIAERFGEFIADPASWVGPGGFFRKGLSALTGAAGSVLGERYGGAPGAIVGGAVGGGAGGFGAGGRGLPSRVPTEIREKTTEEALKGASREGYQQLAELDKYLLPTDQAGTIKRAIQQELVQGERQFRPPDIPGVWSRLEELVVPYGRPNTGRVTVADIERVRQGLNTERMKGGAEALAASDAISLVDEYLVNLPGVAGMTEQARKNWAAYKRGQIVEETIRRGYERALTSGKGANVDNAIRQEFKNRIRNKDKVWKAFTAAEQEQISLIMDPGRGMNLARWLSSFSPRHPITGAIGFFGAGHVTGDPLTQLALLTTGEIAHRFTTRMTQGRAERLLEATRARAPASGRPGPEYFTPKTAPPPAARGAYGAARALGATALSPDVTDVLELPEIEVKPQ